MCYYGQWEIINGTKYCPRGTTGPNDLGPCAACPAGKYKDQPGAGPCSSCPPNSVSPPRAVASTDCACLPGRLGAARFSNRGPCAALGSCATMTVGYLDASSYATATPDSFVRLSPIGSANQIYLVDAASGAVNPLPAPMAASLDRWSAQNPLVAFTPVAYPLTLYRYPDSGGGAGLAGGWRWVSGVVTELFAGVVALDSAGAYTQLAGGAVAPARGAQDGAGPAATFENPTVLAISADGGSAFLDDAGAVRRVDMAAPWSVATIVTMADVKAYFATLGSGSGSYGFYGCAHQPGPPLRLYARTCFHLLPSIRFCIVFSASLSLFLSLSLYDDDDETR